VLKGPVGPARPWRREPAPAAATLPINQWVTVDMFLKRGPAGVGQFYLACDGRVVFDVRDTDIGAEDCRLRFWSPLKLYLDVTTVDWLRERGTPAMVYYDNLEFWSGAPPGRAISPGARQTD
jgi:hypothetical protein